MTYSAVTVPGSGTFRAALAPVLAAAGFTQVTVDYATNLNDLYSDTGTTRTNQAGTVDVWYSPAAGNNANEDWYLIVGEYLITTIRYAVLGVAEGWDNATKLAVRGAPYTNSGTLVPAADFSMGATPTAISALACSSAGTWTNTAGATLLVNATPDRVMVKQGNAVAGNAVYAGKADRFYPVAIDPVTPLLTVQLHAAYASGANSLYGTTTREPGQVGAHTNNFRVQLVGAAAGSIAKDRTYVLNDTPGAVDGITGRMSDSPCAVHCSRFYANSTRAILRDVRVWPGAGLALSDTVVDTLPDGSTRGYVPVNTYIMFPTS